MLGSGERPSHRHFRGSVRTREATAETAAAVDANTDTRSLLAATLKRQLRRMPLSRVTVAGLAREAGVTRQTFYYHFPDVRSLTAWVFTTDVANHILAHATHAEWADGFTELLTYLKEHREQAYAVIDSLGHAELERFLFGALRRMMVAIVAEVGPRCICARSTATSSSTTSR